MYWKLLLMQMVIGVQCHHHKTNMLPDRMTIVHLFEWKWKDVADECERFLANKGFGGVQVSPPSENLIIHLLDGSRPWYERYQVMSYKLTTRSGTREDFLDMTTRCNRVGVRIYADVVVNHMTGDNEENIGTGGSTADFQNYDYPAVPYRREHFHYPHCSVNNYNDVVNVRSCNLVGLKDLNHGKAYVRGKIIGFLNDLIELGVAGFRVDAAKHMWPNELKEIYEKVHNLNTEFGFAPNTRPYIYQEVIYDGHGPINHAEYIPLGDVTEFRVGTELNRAFRGNNDLKWLVNWGEQWNLSPRDKVIVFIDNHDTQRTGGVLTYKDARIYKAAIAFMLAHPYGTPRVMSSYVFDKFDQGPPSDQHFNIISPSINSDDTCGNGWVCEHRWRAIYQMVAFRNAVKDAPVENWWDNWKNQIAFSRGNKGFIVFNLDGYDLNRTFQTGLPQGNYCDVISGRRQDNTCTGTIVSVNNKGKAHIHLPHNAEDVHIAIHVGKESSLQVL